MKIKASELNGVALDWAVAKCESDELAAKLIQYPQCSTYYPKISPSTNWSQGGPIIEREYINISHPNGLDGENDDWIAAWKFGGYEEFRGSTPLIAAMRCFVASRLGSEVEIPEELLS